MIKMQCEKGWPPHSVEITGIFWQIFRESNGFTKKVDKELIPFHEIFSRFSTPLWIIYSHTFLAKKFVKATFLLMNLLNNQFDEIFFQ